MIVARINTYANEMELHTQSLKNIDVQNKIFHHILCINSYDIAYVTKKGKSI